MHVILYVVLNSRMSVANVTAMVAEATAVVAQSALVAAGIMETLALTGGATRRNQIAMFVQATGLEGENHFIFILFEMTEYVESTAAYYFAHPHFASF